MARPPKAKHERRRHSFHVRVNDLELRQLNTYHRELEDQGVHISHARLLRDLALNPEQIRKTRLKRSQRELVRQLRGLGRNLNQLTRLAHRDDQLPDAEALDDLVYEIQNLVRHLLRDERSLAADREERRGAREQQRLRKHETPVDRFLQVAKETRNLAVAIEQGETHRIRDEILRDLSYRFEDAFNRLRASPDYEDEVRQNEDALVQIAARCKTLGSASARYTLDVCLARWSSLASQVSAYRDTVLRR